MILRNETTSVTLQLREAGPVGTPAEGDLCLSVAVAGATFSGRNDVWIGRAEWAGFLEAMRRLSVAVTGEARVTGMSPEEFQLTVFAWAPAGRLFVDGWIGREFAGRAASFRDRVTFSLELDRSMLTEIVAEAAKLAVYVRPGRLTDAAQLAAFAAQSYRETFGAHSRPEDLELYLTTSYGERQQAGELRDPSITTLIADASGSLAGYAQLRPGTTPDCVSGPSPMELWRFYVGPQWQGRGLAQALMGSVVAGARQRGAKTLWLGVWERNPRAQAFYRKCGFVDVGQKAFLVGTDSQTDRVMARTILPDQ